MQISSRASVLERPPRLDSWSNRMGSCALADQWRGKGLGVGLFRASGRAENLNCAFDTDTFIIHHGNQSGEGRLNSDKAHRFEIQTGQFSWLPKNTETASVYERSGGGVFINCAPEFRARMEQEFPEISALNRPISTMEGLSNHEYFSNVVDDFVKSNGFGGRLAAEALLVLILTDVLQLVGQSDPQSSRAAVLTKRDMERISEYIDHHMDEKLSVSRLADLVGMSTFHFARLFKRTTGTSPHKFVVAHRIKQAQSLMLDTQRSLAEISYDVGFSSQSHMTEAFSKVVGVSPSRYRKQASL